MFNDIEWENEETEKIALRKLASREDLDHF